MTEREKVCFKVYGKTNATGSTGTPLPYNTIDFNIGGGSYNNTTTGGNSYRYIVSVAGTYLISYSYMKRNDSEAATVALTITRSGANIFYNLSSNYESVSSTTINSATIVKLEVGDLVWIRRSAGAAVVNYTAYSTSEIKNAFWGIRLDWD